MNPLLPPDRPGPKLDAIRAIEKPQVETYAQRLPRDQLCVATVGPRTV